MTYTADKPPLPETVEQLRARIPGWGVDLDPRDRPSYPKLELREDRTGAHWDFPERQVEERPRERSIEHAFVTPVFGTAQPTRGVSGALRKYAYRRHSEGKMAHWLILMAADRVDSMGSSATSVLRGKPDNPITETGILSEASRGGLRSRLGRDRTDVVHHPMDPFVVATPWLVRAGAVYVVGRSITRRLRG